MNLTTIRAVCALLAAGGCALQPAAIDNTPVPRQPETAVGNYRAVLSVGAGYTRCLRFSDGATLFYRFEATGMLEFAVYYDSDTALRYPVPPHATDAEKGRLTVDMARAYCFSWHNHNAAPVSLSARIDGAQPLPPR